MIRYYLFVLLTLRAAFAHAQTTPAGLKVVSSKALLQQAVRADSNAALASLPQAIPGIVLDIRYATRHNFTGAAQYKKPAAWMRRRPAMALKEVQAELNKKGLGLKIYDAYRPYSVSLALWNAAPDKRYVANPRRGSHHNRGIAIDLTIIDLRTGHELDMGTAFDNFTDTAHHNFTALPPQVLANRHLLKNLMWKHGFNYVPTEWWHYHWRDKNYDVLDLDFSQLQ